MSDIGVDAGWTASATGWLEIQRRGDPNRTLLLDPVMLDLCGDVRGQSVLDVGCGEGRFVRMLAERGANVAGIDIVDAFLNEASSRATSAQRYLRADGAALPFEGGVFDLVIAYLVLVDITDYRAAIDEAFRVLKPGGRFIAANLTFVTASDGWLRDENGKRLYHRVDRYLDERPIILEGANGVPIRIRNWHRPLSAYMDAYLGAGFLLRRFLEPVPADESLRDNPEFEDWFRVPTFDVMLWQKPAE